MSTASRLAGLVVLACTGLDARAQGGPAPGGRLVLTLDDAVKTARARQPQLKQARATTAAAQARTGSALAGLLPQVSAQLGYQRTTGNNLPRPGSALAVAGTDSTTYNSFSGALAVNQLLWDFGATTGRYRASQASAAAAASTERATALLVLLAVRAAFFDTRAAKSLLGVANETLANQQKHLDQTEAFVRSGLRPQIDVVQARTDTANARVQLILAENAYGVSRAGLNQVMGVEGSTDFDVADDGLPPVDGEDAGADALLAEALRARPEVTALAEQVRAQQLTVSALGGQYWPSLEASLGLTQGGVALDQLGWNAAAGLTLNWQLFQGGLTRSQVHEAEANAGALAAELDLLRQQLRFEIDQVRLLVHASKAAVGAAQDALVNARERLRLAEGRYETGAGNIIELGDAQVALTQAASQRVQADFRLATARAQLLKALGRE